MSKLILFAALAAMALPAGATRRLTVAQLEKTLDAASEKHRADDEAVHLLGEAVLTERLTDASRDRIAASLHLSPKAILALQLLADQSFYLDPPAAELPSAPAPDAVTAQRILDDARIYVAKTLPRLPDFFATRTTYRFDDSPQILGANQWPVRAGLHPVGKSSIEITFRNDQLEPPAPQPAKTASGPPAPVESPGEHGMQTRGEFGVILAMIFVDAGKSGISFHHWEQAPGGLVAVYRYAVAKSASQYTVDYCCIAFGSGGGGRQGGGRRGGGGSAQTANAPPDASNSLHKTVGYHGSLFIDPASGTIFRLTLEGEMGSGPVSRAAAVIDYGPMVIGDRKYICPLRSIALTEAEAGSNFASSGVATDPYTGVNTIVQVNETSFTDYHRLGSTTRILTDAPASPPAAAAPAPAPPPVAQP